MTERPTVWMRVRAAWAWFRAQEPAYVQAIYKSLVGVLIAAGVAVPDWLDARVSAVIVAVYLFLSFWQAKATKAKVVPAVNVPPQYYSENIDAGL